ncbi:hypothetical protein [Cellvibrio sp. pealriver]|uniref:hypothetical protein n=1 Tax=Cellvibrio sp. pealriver TaxID=1622269 RepID=UPI00066FEE48|nr:hypothetical protein [Cellvibrio sp. pealriver]
MINPYEAPQSELTSETGVLRRKIGWRIFFWIFMPLVCLSLWSVFADAGSSIVDKCGELIVYTMITLGVFGFAHNKKIMFSKFWRYFIPCAIVWDAYTLITQDWSVFSESDNAVYILISITLLCLGTLLFLQYYALYQYAFHSKEIWDK